MRFFIFFSILFFLFSCGRKRVITSMGDMMLGNKKIHWEIYTERDTTFRTLSDNGRITALDYSATEAELNDSTFSEKNFAANGNLLELKSFLNGKPDGEWTSFYANGKKKSVSTTNNGTLIEYRSWYDNGQPQVNGERLANGKMKRTEFFESGKISENFDIDSSGTGYCVSYYMNGEKKEEGNVGNYSPIGVWKRYDSLGNALHDTLLGVPFLKIPPDPKK